MPYKIVKVGHGWVVENKETGKRYSGKPIPRERAEAQLRVLRMVGK